MIDDLPRQLRDRANEFEHESRFTGNGKWTKNLLIEAANEIDKCRQQKIDHQSDKK